MVQVDRADLAETTRARTFATPGATFARPWLLVGCLTVTSMLALIDKNVITLMVGGVKTSFGLSDTQVGLVVGVAFALANLAISLPAGWLADRGDRRAIVACGVVIWSIMAATCGAANGFLQLFLARAGVGIGEGLTHLIRDGSFSRLTSVA